MQQAIQHSQKASQEIAGIAASFEDICQELVNNRVDSQQRQQRIQGQIIDPLQQIAQLMFPEWDQKLQALESRLQAPGEPPAADEALEQADRILAAMESVLAMMLEVEDYNELVDMVRSLIRDQEAIIDQTKQQRKKQLLGPLGSGL